MNKKETNQELLLEQYKMFVETAEQVTNRRQTINSYYLAGLTGLFSIPYTLGIDLVKNVSTLTFFTSIIGVLLATLWLANLISAKQLNKAKFIVIQDMEKQLPYPCYQKEWQELDEGKKASIYLEATKVEFIAPIILGIPYLILFFYALVHSLVIF